ncbi:rho GTPase-activating protein 25 [Planoprotostelium fungivorum]|uniref:Rho GTPase-activating protein 25 n=1 Tax=Planoprotostelium fungivorum TaxID=1890364 RepID=A0A2P6NGC9_9EUKA|nr:rho GTPase-activating protein 25 [Planoprotostelium fungivorum]
MSPHPNPFYSTCILVHLFTTRRSTRNISRTSTPRSLRSAKQTATPEARGDEDKQRTDWSKGPFREIIDQREPPSRPFMGIEREGWLLKAGQKRFFRLNDNVLSWFKTPSSGSPKGSVEMTDYYLEVEKTGNYDKNLVLTPKSKEKKTYTLTGPNDEVDQWFKVMDQSIRYNKLQHNDGQKIFKQGWLTKKGQQRWFFIKNNTLYWFIKEQFVNSDFEKEAKGSLDLSLCSLVDTPNAALTINIRSTSQGLYTLSTKIKEDYDDWVTILGRVIRKSATMTVERLDIPVEGEKRGYLVKKGKKRWFIVRNGALSWQDTEWSEKINGKLLLNGCTVTISTARDRPNSFVVSSSDGTIYEMSAKSPQEVQEWVSSVNRGIISEVERKATISEPKGFVSTYERKGWLMKKGKKRYFLLRKGVLMWQEKEFGQDGVRGYLNLKECYVERDKASDFSFVVHEPTSDYLLTARNKDEMEDWVHAIQKCIDDETNNPTNSSLSNYDKNSKVEAERVIKRGCMTKKGLVRWFELSDDTLRWFETANYDLLCNSLSLYNCLVTEASETTISISTPDMNKMYLLQTRDAVEQREWVRALEEAVITAGRINDIGFERRVRRWVVLKGGVLMWFATYQRLDACTRDNANHSVVIEDYIFSISQTNPSTIDASNPKTNQRFNLEARNHKEAADWLGSLRKGKIPEIKSVDGLFGKSLEVLSVGERGVPEAIEILTTYLCKHGTMVPGIFRISCNYDLRNRLKVAFERDPRCANDWPGDTDTVHVVAALIKSLLRELPDPVVPEKHYREFISAGGCATNLRNTISQFPIVHRAVLKHIITFIKIIAEKSSVNKMTEANLCIVFGPNLVRSSALTALEGLVDTARILDSVQLLCSQSRLLFASESYRDLQPCSPFTPRK